MHPTKEVIASWPKANFKDPVTRGHALTIVNIIFIVLVFLTVGLRYYTRVKITRSFGQDDIVIGLSLVSRRVLVYGVYNTNLTRSPHSP